MIHSLDLETTMRLSLFCFFALLMFLSRGLVASVVLLDPGNDGADEEFLSWDILVLSTSSKKILFIVLR